MAVTAETRNAIIELVVTAYNSAPGTTLLTELVEAVDGGASLADVATTLTTSSTFRSLYPTFQTTAEFAEELLSNLVPSVATDSDAYAEGKAAIEFVLNSGGTRADVILQAQTFLAGLSTEDPSFGEPAAAFQNKVTVATYYTVTLERDGDINALQNAISGVDSTAESVTTAQATLDGQSTGGTTTNLTDKLDTVAGTTANDTVNGIVSNTTADVTYQVADSIDLGAGTGDVLNVSIISDNADRSYAGRQASGVEIINLKHVDGDSTATTSTFNVSSISGLTQTWVKDGTVIGTNDDTVSVQGVSSSSVVGVANNDSDLKVTFTTTGTATSGDSITLAVGGGSTGAVTLNDAPGDGFATVNIVTSGAAGSISSLTSTDLTTLNISGDQKFTSVALDSDITTLDASANTAGVTVNATAGSKLKATGSAADSDTLVLNIASSISEGMAVSAFETVSLDASASSTLDMDLISGYTALAVGSGSDNANDLTLQDLAANPVISFVGLGTSTSTIDANGIVANLKDATGTSDSITVNVNNRGVSAGTNDAVIGDFIANNIETVTLNTGDFDDVTFDDFSIPNAKSFTVTGSGDVNFNGLEAAALETLTGGSATGDLTLGTFDNVSANMTATLGSGKDTLQIAAVASGKSHVYNTGAGDDTVTVVDLGNTTNNTTAKADINLGDGDDKVTITLADADAIGATTGTAQVNAIEMDGGAGTDRITITLDNDDTTAESVNFSAFTGIEELVITGGGATDTKDDTITLNVATGYNETLAITGVASYNAAADTIIQFVVGSGGTVNTSNVSLLGSLGGTTTTDKSGIELVGTTGNETLTGGSLDENFDGGTGADTINLGTGTDRIFITAGDTGTYTAPTGTITSVSTTSFDVITGAAAGDQIFLTNYTAASADILAANAIDSDAEGASNDLSATTAAPDNSIHVFRGDYSSSGNTFTESATGADSLVIFDANPASGGAVTTQAFVVTGVTAITGAANAGQAGLITI